MCFKLLNNSKHGHEIGVGGQKLKLSNIGIEIHVGSPLPSKWHQCLDLQVCSVFFLIIYCVFLLFMFFFFVMDVVEMKWLDHNSLTVTEYCYTCRCTRIGHKDQIYYWISHDFHKLQPRNRSDLPRFIIILLCLYIKLGN